ncbi:MAG: hypothetical protein ABI790_07820 [Betaproteobacteria bacterium]
MLRHKQVALASTVAAKYLGGVVHLRDHADSGCAHPRCARQDIRYQAGLHFTLSELYDTLQGAIWSELKAGGDINPLRCNLQREHLRRVVNTLIKPVA